MRLLALAFVLLLTTHAHAQCTPPATQCGGAAPTGVVNCTAPGQVCCASVGHQELSCPAGDACTADGNCIPSSGDGGADCAGGGARTLASCGGDTCSCSVACTHGTDCMSGCCTTGGYCAPACVCSANGRLYLGCDSSGAGFGPLANKSCSAAPGEAPYNDGAWLLLLALVPLAMRRIRTFR